MSVQAKPENTMVFVYVIEINQIDIVSVKYSIIEYLDKKSSITGEYLVTVMLK